MKDFLEFPKIPRLSREMIITEKIDGTNAQILITELGEVFAGSRNRWLTPQDDNFGFAKWVEDNKQEVLKLGVGRHFGEWWGSGIQRGYGLQNGEKRLSIFNVGRWCLFGQEPKSFGVNKMQDILPHCIGLVPILYEGIFDTNKVNEVLSDLRTNGSRAADGFMNPEGVIMYHIAANQYFKKTIHKDEEHKTHGTNINTTKT